MCVCLRAAVCVFETYQIFLSPKIFNDNICNKNISLSYIHANIVL